MRILFFFLLVSTLAHAQTTLPTTWDFATSPASLPTGWSTNTTGSYSSGLPDNAGGTSKAGKLQSTGHYFIVHFSDEPGYVTYNLRAYSSNGSNFSGTFQIQESVNGSSWNTIHAFNNNDFGDQWDEFTDSLDVDSRYVRFYFSNKISGINVGLDDVEIAEFVPAAAEINVRFDGDDVPDGTGVQFACNLGDTLFLPFIIENLGTDSTLIIDDIDVSGTAVGDYFPISIPVSIAPLNTDTLVVRFIPSTTGSRLVNLEIDNNDANESPYNIELAGIGGSGATEPLANPDELIVELLKTYRIGAYFQEVEADGYLVLAKRNAAINASPQDGVSYEKGEGIGDAKVAAVGDDNAFWIREATAWDTFYVAVFAYNGAGSLINYRQSEPLLDTIITPIASMVNADYYDEIDVTSNAFVDDLHDLIRPHITRFYSDYEEWMIPRLIARDTVNSKDVVTCVYSDDDVLFSPPFGWVETGMNREHTLPASWMPSNGNSGTAEYQDYHHLFPTVSTANGQRGNDPLGNVVNVTSSYGKGKRGTDANGNTVYEPKKSQKGDAARAMMYMMTAYHDPSGGDSWALEDLASNGPNQKLQTLINWHLNDLPSGFERARNDYLDSLQQNRNPFIDSAHWVCYIDFKTMDYIASPDSTCLAKASIFKNPSEPDTNDSTIGLYELDASSHWIHYPNPTQDKVYIEHAKGGNVSLTVHDVHGAVVGRSVFEGSTQLNVYDLPNGLYLISLLTSEASYSFRLVKE